MNTEFWKNKKVLITGHTGFKGSWLSLWLAKEGAWVTGLGLEPPTSPNLFELAQVSNCIEDIRGEIRDFEWVQKVVEQTRPEIIFHLAAQPLVRESYRNPVETFETNIMGTIHLLDAVRQVGGVRAIVNVTTDKCYENQEWNWGYRENDTLGGYDPYSSSKACSELATMAYRNSFFHVDNYNNHGTAIATARAGNVIGGGDFARERLVPDFIRAAIQKEKIIVRNPQAVRPWQHVLEPLNGYLMLAEKLYTHGIEYASAWNFGPRDEDIQTVEWIIKQLSSFWDEPITYQLEPQAHFHESNLLRLDCSKARTQLGWKPKWELQTALEKTIQWVKAYTHSENIQAVCMDQIHQYKHLGETENG